MKYQVVTTNDQYETVVVAEYQSEVEANEKVLDLGDRSILAKVVVAE